MLYMDRDGRDSLYAGDEWGQVWIFPLCFLVQMEG